MVKILSNSTNAIQCFLLSSLKKVVQSKMFSAIFGLFMATAFIFFVITNAIAAPLPDLLSPTHGQGITSPSPEISGAAFGANEVLIFIDDKLNGKAVVKDDWFTYRPFLPLSSGSHIIQLQSSDVDTRELGEKTIPISITIIPNPSPSFLVPEQGSYVGQSRAWVGGVSNNNSLVRVLVDGVEHTRVMTKNHSSGVGSFGVQLKNVELGAHTITAIARDVHGKESFVSEDLVITVEHSVPAPILYKPVVNSDSGIERPFITGIVKNNLDLYIVIDDKIVHRLPAGSDSSGVISFAWQPKKSLGLGKHKIELFASHNGKLSTNSKPVYWQVGDFLASIPAKENELVTEFKEIETEDDEKSVHEILVTDPEVNIPMSVVDDLVTKPESPVVPDVILDDGVGNQEDDKGRILTDDDLIAQSDDGENSDEVIKVSPGAVVRNTTESNTGSEFKFNTSLVIGIVILIFLLLSILVWYIQEKRAQLGERVVSIFKEDEEGDEKNKDSIDIGINLPKDTPNTDKKDPLSPTIEDMGLSDFGEYDFPKEPPKTDQPFRPPTQEPPQSPEKSRGTNKTNDFPPPPPPMF